MSLSAIITMLLVLGLTWGLFAVLLIIAIRKEKNR